MLIMKHKPNAVLLDNIGITPPKNAKLAMLNVLIVMRTLKLITITI